jgi:hypothetical protein
LGEKILRSKTKANYYWSEEIGRLVKEKKRKILEMDKLKRPTGQDRP